VANKANIGPKNDQDLLQISEECCGGPTSDDAACCVEDAEAKATSADGCGCGSAPMPSNVLSSASCVTDRQTSKETRGAALENEGRLGKESSNDQVREAVRQQYSRVVAAAATSCNAGSGCCDAPSVNVVNISQGLGYTVDEVSSVPTGANMGLGCGNPQAIANLKFGETVLDLGSGGGFDCFLAAREVGDSGYVIGVDMTPEMVSKARDNAEKGHYQDVDFRLGKSRVCPSPMEAWT
jgi:hypothetical protein